MVTAPVETPSEIVADLIERLRGHELEGDANALIAELFPRPVRRALCRAGLGDELLAALDAAGNGYFLIEVDENGEAVITVGAGGKSADIHAELIIQIGIWLLAGGGGRLRESAGAYLIKGLGRREPDVSWLNAARAALLGEGNALPQALPVPPNFVAEVVSPSDDIEQQRGKMRMWIANEVEVGWLIDPFDEQVHIYRPGREPVVLDRPETLEVGPEMPGLTIDFRRIWEL